MNGRKARALRKQAAETAKTMKSDYQTEPRIINHYKYDVPVSPRRLVGSCHRAVYQWLKKNRLNP